MIAAAALATSATAMKLANNTTNMAQTQSVGDCHGTYAYQCIEAKVTDSLGRMTAEVQDHKEDCIVSANDLREEIVTAIFDLRDALEDAIDDQREADHDANQAKFRDATKNIEDATAATVQNLCDEAEARVYDHSEISLARQEVEGEIKKIYFEDHSADPYGQKEAIKALVEAFAAKVDAEGGSYAAYAGRQVDALEALISDNVSSTHAQFSANKAAWDGLVDSSTKSLNDAITDRTAHMDAIIAGKQADMDAIVAHLTEDFLLEFWATIEMVYQEVSYYERQGLIWKALYQKDEFLAGIDAIRTWLFQGLADNRSMMVSELNAERDLYVAFVNGQNATYVADNNAFRASLAGTVADSRDTVIASIDEKTAFLDSKNKNDEAGTLEDYVYDLANISYHPTGYGNQHANGFQPYAKWVANDLQAQIDVFAEDSSAVFDAENAATKNILDATLANQKAELAADNVNAQNLLDATTATLIENLVAARERFEAGLTDWQNAQEERDHEARWVDQAALVSTKNQCWRDLSWIIRQTFVSTPGGPEIGYSAGPVFGFLNQFAQTKQTDVTIAQNPDYPEPYGFGNEGVHDGYDPYGYGDYGFGYGYSQF
jgi:hypothetical protein